MQPRLINLLYKRENCELEAEVIGIPANVCTTCYYRIIPGTIAKYIDSLVDPIFAAETAQRENPLPAPHIGIQFPALERDLYCPESTCSAE